MRIKKSKNYTQKHRGLKIFLLLLLGTLLFIGVWAGLVKYRSNRYQSKLDPFYSTSNLSTIGAPGQLLRSEKLSTNVDGGTGWRVLYRTQHADGTFTFSSGLVFVPNNANAGTPRPVAAWAHGTIGMGDSCAPSRSTNPATLVPGLTEMLAKGWVVAATDYSGLGTPGIERYLIGGDEAHDVLNSVRAARSLPGSQAGSTYAVWGHSQGGNSALFTANLSASYAPELKLAGTVASAPAAELSPLLTEQYNTALDWAIGPEIMMSWPQVYTTLNPSDVLTSTGERNYQKLANKCIQSAAVSGIVRNNLKQKFFKVNPMTIPAWQTAAAAQTAPILNSKQPLMVAESTTDQVVLPDTTALYIQKACQAGSNLSQLWLADVGHIKLAPTIAPAAIGWMDDRFHSRPAIGNCQQTPPVQPASSS